LLVELELLGLVDPELAEKPLLLHGRLGYAPQSNLTTIERERPLCAPDGTAWAATAP